MGSPMLTRGEIGIVGNSNETFINQEVDVEGVKNTVTCVGFGNPHAIIFVDEVQKADVVGLGSKIRNLFSVFPKGINVHFLQHLEGQEYRIRSYERGVENETLSCGTGVCAAAVVAFLNNKTEPRRTFKFYALGGEMSTELKVEGDNIMRTYLIGPAVEVFNGEFEYEPSERFQKAAYRFIHRVIPR
jgi:diaminopimelate epimerase